MRQQRKDLQLTYFVAPLDIVDADYKRQLYVAELSTITRRRDEDWATFGDALRILADKAYRDLEEKARERIALNQFLAQIKKLSSCFQREAKTAQQYRGSSRRYN